MQIRRLHELGLGSGTRYDAAVTASVEPTPAHKRASRIGLILFVPYGLLYAAFMGLNIVDPAIMGRSWGPLNLAVGYGLALIAAALFLAVIYTWRCGSGEKGSQA